MQEIREQLHQVEDRLRALRQDKARGIKIREAAKKAYAESDVGEDSPLYQAALEAVNTVAGIEAELQSGQEQQTALLKQVGDLEAGQSGFTLGGESGWATAARRLDLNAGELRADVS